MDTNQIDTVYERFQQSLVDNAAAFDKVEIITELSRIDQELEKSIQVVLNFRSIVEHASGEIQKSYEVLINDVETYFHETHSTQIILFYTNEYIRNKHDLSEVFQHLDNFFTAVIGTNGTLESINRTISELGEIIDLQIEKQRSLALRTFFLISSILIAVILVYTWIITRSINSRVRFIDSFLKPIGQGDLSDRITEQKNDEIAVMISTVNEKTDQNRMMINELEGETGNFHLKKKG
ncbi:methyl-accepting chemotaxis protein [Marispirochaeta sp.]|uniref:methyl-accepting chemotaxis protein n=1 Tax=Marispirochaeta sp. TaxID=2038653 RepID=UPI0029C80672|nr:methyl-accepting chemotaxis protein [Marispirochaeta sp.]